MPASASMPAARTGPDGSTDPADHATGGPAAVLSAADVGRIADRLAHQIVEQAAKDARDLVLIGIPTRGVPLAHRLAARIHRFADLDVPVGSVDITMYRDDLRLRGVRPLEHTAVPDGGVDGRIVVLVDDVLCSGRTCRAALDALTELGRPAVVQLATLVDRGHRELPIRADYVGKNLPTSPTQKVRVLLDEIDGQDAVLVSEAAAESTTDGGTTDA